MMANAAGGALAALGVVLFAAGVRGVGALEPGAARVGPPRLARERFTPMARRAGLGAGVALAALVVTGWPVGAVLAGVAAVALPPVVGGAASVHASVAKTEAVAAWAEMLRDTMAGAAGIEEAITASAPSAPLPIRAAVVRLAARLEHHERLAPSLRAFAAELADPGGDVVAVALLLATQHHGGDLGGMLSRLVVSARAEAAMRLRVETGRTRTRTAVRVVVATTLGFAGLLVVSNRAFLAPYEDPLGQAWLLVVGMIFGLGLHVMHRLAQIDDRPRLLARQATGGQ